MTIAIGFIALAVVTVVYFVFKLQQAIADDDPKWKLISTLVLFVNLYALFSHAIDLPTKVAKHREDQNTEQVCYIEGDENDIQSDVPVRALSERGRGSDGAVP